MLGRAVVVFLLLTILPFGVRAQSNVPVEVVSTASEYIPRTVTTSHPGHSYTDCSGTTSYWELFNPATDSVSGIAHTNVSCSTTSYPATQSTSTEYRRVSYTIVRS